MDQQKILVFGQSRALVDEVQPELSRLLPAFRLQAAAGNPDELSEFGRGDVAGSVVCLQGREEEPWVTSLLQSLREQSIRIPIFVVTQDDDADSWLRWLELGAWYCTSRHSDLSRLAALLDVLSVPGRSDCAPRFSWRAAHEAPPPSVAGFVFLGRALGELYDRILAAANSDTAVLLTGETGTGKSHAARAIHDLSPRRNGPFVAVGCGGLSSTLLQSQLFGHVPGAFPGADCHQVGKFATADDGTILLDEIDCVHLEVQAQLLRILGERVYEPIGSQRTSEVRARVLLAANRPLGPLVAAGQFRSDLFLRLSEAEVRLPSLRDSREAIVPLAEKFLAVCCTRMARTVSDISVVAQAALRAYEWPGNVRELRNAIERAVTLCRRDRLDLADLPEALRRSGGSPGQSTHTSACCTVQERTETQ